MKKRFYTKIELQLHALTCPGVWLCTSGYMEVTIKTLGYFFKTGALEPKFPALCHDQFVMEGYFKAARSVAQLERVMRMEALTITLWQNGQRLAHFAGTLSDLLQPPFARVSCFHNTNVQVLMNPSRRFPGIISPKLEISVLASIHDNPQKLCHHQDLGAHILASSLPCKPIPSVISSSSEYSDGPGEIRRQKPVCHAKKEQDNEWKRATTHSREDYQTDFQHLSSRVSSATSSRTSSSRKHANCVDKLSDQLLCTGIRDRRCSDSCSSSADSRYSSSPTSPPRIYHYNHDDNPDEHHKNCRICSSYSSIFH